MKRYFVMIGSIILISSLLSISCKKAATNSDKDIRIEQLKASNEFRVFEEIFSSELRGIDYSAARFIDVDKNLSSIHIPVKRNGNVVAAVIAFPKEVTGAFELVYQDNSHALSGTGSIYQRTTDKAVRRIFVVNNKILGSNMLTEETTTVNGLTGEYLLAAEEGCGFLCRLDRCYNAVKAEFPGDTACGLLDIFYGVCTAATTTTCLIKMARGEY
jgi:hypothetical protein